MNLFAVQGNYDTRHLDELAINNQHPVFLAYCPY
jgi:hypothetical protein